ncbi:serine acetyltransferase [bacterium]|nr:serine acetyltransferase [bacterium]
MNFKKIFSVSIYDFSIIIYFLGIKITSSALYNLIYGNPLYTNCTILQDIKDLKRRGVQFLHPLGIVIAPEVKIGDNCIIMQNVTIGYGGSEKSHGYPIIGNNVKIFAGAVVVGNIKVGEGAVIAANSVVTKDVEPNTMVAGAPAKFKKKLNF